MTESELREAIANAGPGWGRDGQFPRGTVTIPRGETIKLTSPLSIPKRVCLVGEELHTYENGGLIWHEYDVLPTGYQFQCEPNRSGRYNGSFSQHIRNIRFFGKCLFGAAQISTIQNNYFHVPEGTDLPCMTIGRSSGRLTLAENNYQASHLAGLPSIQYTGTGARVQQCQSVGGWNNHYHRCGVGLHVHSAHNLHFTNEYHEGVQQPIRLTGGVRSFHYNGYFQRCGAYPFDVSGAHSLVEISGILRECAAPNPYYIHPHTGQQLPIPVVGDPTTKVGATFKITI